MLAPILTRRVTQVVAGGRGAANYRTVVKETLDWFDRYLGPVK
jgi:hypothetical protein